MQQEDFQISDSLHIFYSYYTELGGGKTFGIIIVVLLPLLDQRPRVVYLACLLSVAIGIVNVTKMAYVQPRPFWVEPAIEMKEISCSKEYGNASGHSFLAACLASAIFLDLNGLV